jgi:predicted transposase YbfD/YdcC
MATTPRPLADYFADLRDPRIALKCEHDFMAIILIVVCATLAGADDFVSMATFADAKRTWLRERLGLDLSNGIPSHDTLNRVFAAIHPDEFGACFLGWVEAMSDRLKLKQIAIDGKAMRGSRRRTAAGYRTVQVVSAWASENGVTLAQVRTDEKSNEITAIPELLRLLDVSGALVSIDAAGCQKGIAARVVAGGGDYLLAVKENQPRLFEDIGAMAQAAVEADYKGLSRWATNESGHGRREFRFGFVMTNLEGIRDRDEWKGLRSVVCVVSGREVKGKKETSEVRYYISSRRGSGKMFLGASRTHWGIENECHWVLDVAFREDDHRLREGHAPENMSVVRKMALAMLKKADANMGIKNKRLRAGWDDTFLERVLRDFLGK